MRSTDPEHALTELAEASGNATAVTLAVIQGAEQAVLCHGREARSGDVATPATAYELGSVTKTFTALLLAEMAARQEVGYLDPIDAHLPRSHRPTVRRGGPITLLHLATHTAGLPRLPPGVLTRALPSWRTNPYAAYRDDHLLDALSRTEVHRRPGSRLQYSNYGVALLGRLLAERAGTQYATLVADRVCRPLGLTVTGCEAAPAAQAVGHRRGRPLPPWSIPGLPGAGALRSSGRDLLRYLRAHLEPDRLPQLTAALRQVQQPRVGVPRSSDRLCLIWNLRRIADHDVLFHAGATRGFTSFVGFSPRTRTAVAALTNTGPGLAGRFIQTSYDFLRRLTTSVAAPP